MAALPNRFSIALLLGIVGGLVLGCAGEGDQAAQTPVVTELSEAQSAQKERALAARDQLFQSLVGELTGSMAEKGPAQSIGVCRERAPEIAKQVSQETGVRIGRTSFQLRNPENQPPAWATDFVADRVEEEVVVALPEAGLGVLTPIRLQTTCTICHGPKSEMLPEVKVALASNYPRDQATGFAVGDLRGYFWMEVPVSSRPN